MSKLKKRILALGMAFVMTITMIPMFASLALADETPATITVYLTVSDQGVLAKANDNSIMAGKEVTVTDIDEDGTYTFEEALVAAHKAYNTEDGYGISGGFVNKLWGKDSTNNLFFINGKGLSEGVTVDTIQGGDFLLASINKDNTFYADWYTEFDKASVEATAGDEITLTLTGYQGMTSYMNPDMAPIAGVSVKTVDGTVLGTTGEDGKVTFQAPAAGEYVVTAEGTVKDEVTYYSIYSLASDGGAPFGYMSSDFSESYVAYTEADYGDGPYPADEIKFIDFFEEADEDSENDYAWEDTHYLKSTQVIADCPIMAPAANLKVENKLDELTVDNKYRMFKPTAATLITSAEGQFIELTYASTSYDKAYVGTAKEAVVVGDPAKLAERSTEGKYLIPVTVLGEEFKVAFHSVNNEGWYDRIFTIDLNEKKLTTDTTGGAMVPDTYGGAWDEELAVESSLGMFQIESTKVTVEDDGTATIMIKAGNPSRSFPKIALIVQTATEDEKEGAAIIGTPTGDSNNNYIYEFSIPVEQLGVALPISHYQTRKGTSEWHNWSEQHTITINSVDVVNQLIGQIQIQKNNEFTEKYIATSRRCWEALPEEKQEEDDGYFSEDTGDASKDDPRNQDEIGEKELLVVSFGTSFNGSRVATIKAVEDALAKAFPDYSVRRAFTAQIIINHIWARDGEVIDNMEQALDRAVANNVKELVVQPTHLMHGAEYDEMCEALAAYEDKFEKIIICEPLLNTDKDKTDVAKAVVEATIADSDYDSLEAADAAGAAIVYMGHGTSHEANVTYTEMQAIFDGLGYKNVFVGTVEGKPESTSLPEVKKAVENAGYTKVILRPLMVVAGDHANNDMAADEEGSWYYAFVNGGEFEVEGADEPVDIGEGFGAANVTCQIVGLGEIPAIQKVYVKHVSEEVVKEIPYEGGKTFFVKASLADKDEFGMWRVKEGSYTKLEGNYIVIHIVPNNTTTYGWMYWGGIYEDLTKDVTLNANGTIDITVPKEKGGYAYPIAPIKKSDGGTTKEQYYLAIPSAEKLAANEAAAAEVEDMIADLPATHKLTVADKAKVDAALEAYEALSDGEKAAVDNYEELKIAEATIANLEKDAQIEDLQAQIAELQARIAELEAKLSRKEGWNKIEDKWYYCDANRDFVKGWVKDGSSWYFMDKETGEMKTGWLKDGESWYYLKSSGAMAASEWCEGYWLNANGTWTYTYKGSWKQDSTGWWFGDTSGWYAKSTTVKIDNVNYTFNASGYWVK